MRVHSPLTSSHCFPFLSSFLKINSMRYLCIRVADRLRNKPCIRCAHRTMFALIPVTRCLNEFDLIDWNPLTMHAASNPDLVWGRRWRMKWAWRFRIFCFCGRRHTTEQFTGELISSWNFTFLLIWICVFIPFLSSWRWTTRNPILDCERTRGQLLFVGGAWSIVVQVIFCLPSFRCRYKAEVKLFMKRDIWHRRQHIEVWSQPTGLVHGEVEKKWTKLRSRHAARNYQNKTSNLKSETFLFALRVKNVMWLFASSFLSSSYFLKTWIY